MRYPKKDKKKRHNYIINEEREGEIFPDYFQSRGGSLLITGNRPPKIGRRGLHRGRREEFRFIKTARNEQNHRSYLKRKLKTKACEERKKYIKHIFSTEKGRSLLEAFKKKFDHFVKKGDTDKAELCEKIISKLLNAKKNIKSEISSVVKICRLLKESNDEAPSRLSKEDMLSLMKLRESINQRLSKLRIHENNEFAIESDDDSDDSDEYVSFLDDDCSEEDVGDIDNLTASVKSSDLESVDSQSDTESFRDIVNMINHQFKYRINKLLKHLKKKIVEGNEEESDWDEHFPIEKRNKFNEINENGDKSPKEIKQEFCEKKKRNKKAEKKEKEILEEERESKYENRFQKQKLSHLIGTFFYDKIRQGKSESSLSPKSSDSDINIKQEETDKGEENKRKKYSSSDSDSIPSPIPVIPPFKGAAEGKSSFELFMERFK